MSKILAAQDQENLTYIRQTAAAAKPFHQGHKAPGAPSNKAFKTPLKPSLTNEDVFFKEVKPAMRQNGKGNENTVTEAKGGASKASFITPAAARNRAPLGIKTTNAKAKTVQATAPLTIGNDSALKQPKSRSPRLRRLKVTVQQPEFKHALTQDEEPDTEYAPPPPQDLQDFPEDEFSLQRLKALFSGRNLIRGYHSVYIDPVDDDGVPQSERRLQREREEAIAEQDALIQKAIDAACFEIEGPLNKTATRSGTQSKTKTLTGASRIPVHPDHPRGNSSDSSLSRLAATTLSQDTKGAPNVKPRAHFAAPTASSTQARKTKIISKTTQLVPQRRTVNPAVVAAAATANSRSTLGYGKGRVVSAALRVPKGGASTSRSAGRAESVRTAGGSRASRSNSTATSVDVRPNMAAMQDLTSQFRTVQVTDSDNEEQASQHGNLIVQESATTDEDTNAMLDDELADFQLVSPACLATDTGLFARD